MKTAELTNTYSPNNFCNNQHSDPSQHSQNDLPKSPPTLRPHSLHTILSRTALFYSMREKRRFSAGAFHPEHGWMISGGLGDGERLLPSSEVTRDGISFEEFPALPIALYTHSIVALDGDYGDFLVTGGHPGGTRYNARTFIFKNEWTEVKRMPTARDGKKPNLQG